MGGGVADVRSDRLLAVTIDDGSEQLFAAGKGLVPRHLSPRLAVANQRLAQAVGIVVEVAEGRALGADVAAAPDVVAVGPDQDDLLLLDVHLEAAHRLAQRTRP